MRIVYGYKEKGLWWFRIFGYGIKAKNTRTHMLLFSERHGYSCGMCIGHWYFGFLKPRQI